MYTSCACQILTFAIKHVRRCDVLHVDTSWQISLINFHILAAGIHNSGNHWVTSSSVEGVEATVFQTVNSMASSVPD